MMVELETMPGWANSVDETSVFVRPDDVSAVKACPPADRGSNNPPGVSVFLRSGGILNVVGTPESVKEALNL